MRKGLRGLHGNVPENDCLIANGPGTPGFPHALGAAGARLNRATAAGRAHAHVGGRDIAPHATPMAPDGYA